jgi:hypothetical protein
MICAAPLRAALEEGCEMAETDWVIGSNQLAHEAVVEWAKAAGQDTKPSTLLTVRIRSLPGGAPDRGDRAAGIRRVIARLDDPGDTDANGGFKRQNREVLERMRRADREAWASVEHRLGDRDLREGR